MTNGQDRDNIDDAQQHQSREEQLKALTDSKKKSARATEILNQMNENKKSSSTRMKEQVRKGSQRAKVIFYGKENLPAGPAIYDSDKIIVVEGKADVLNLLKMGVENTIALEGTNVSSSVTHLCNQREVTALLDGDRGGDSILKELLLKTKIEYVARAPKGKEIEHLSLTELKEILEGSVIPIIEAEFIDDRYSVRDFLKKHNKRNYFN